MMSAFNGVHHRRKPGGLHANDFNIGLQCLGRRGHACNQAAAAHGNYQRVQIRHFIQHFQTHGALAGHNGFVVIRVNKNQPFTFGQHQRMGARLIQRIAMHHHFSAKAPRAFNFDARCKARHHHHGAQAQTLRVISHALCVVARAHCNHAALPFFGGELR